jgi:putative transposase
LGTPVRSYRHRRRSSRDQARRQGVAAHASGGPCDEHADEPAVREPTGAADDDAPAAMSCVVVIDAASVRGVVQVMDDDVSAALSGACAATIRAAPAVMAAATTVTDAVTATECLLDAHAGIAIEVEAAALAAAVAATARGAARRPHPASLSASERHDILEILCSPRFVDLPPRQVFMTLLDDGRYYCSVRTMYRLLTDHGLSGDRRRGGHQQPGAYGVPVIEASRPNMAWSWDITKLRGPATGVLYYLYTILDIFSRKVVGWTIALRESAHIAEDVIRDAIEREGIIRDQLTLHADRGGPMIALGVAELLVNLGIRKSHSRPRVSNDNPYSESQFKTLKYRPDYPERFESAHAAHEWCSAFFQWYNTVHYHSSIGYLRPADLHASRHPEILQQRRDVLDQAREQHPERFTKRPALAQPPQRAWINKPAIQTS